MCSSMAAAARRDDELACPRMRAKGLCMDLASMSLNVGELGSDAKGWKDASAFLEGLSLWDDVVLRAGAGRRREVG